MTEHQELSTTLVLKMDRIFQINEGKKRGALSYSIEVDARARGKVKTRSTQSNMK